MIKITYYDKKNVKPEGKYRQNRWKTLTESAMFESNTVDWKGVGPLAIPCILEPRTIAFAIYRANKYEQIFRQICFFSYVNK